MLSAWAAAEAGRYRSILLLRRHEKHRVFQITRWALIRPHKIQLVIEATRQDVVSVEG
jgi:hypothetical protein